VSSGIFGRREMRPAETTWMPEDIELGPDWVREEILRSTRELREWMSDQIRPTGGSKGPSRSGGARRGRRPKK